MPGNFFKVLELACERKESLLCVGLDPRVKVSGDEDIVSAILTFTRRIIEETHPYAAAFKPNIAFYEAFGPEGLVALKETLKLIPEGTPVILDAKRNDIGQTAQAYAEAVFGYYAADCATINPYLGKESVLPFLKYPGKGLFALCRTSNPGSRAIQELMVGRTDSCSTGFYRRDFRPLYLEIAREVSGWGAELGLVVGATDPEALARIRAELPEIWLLAPGIGAQGGPLEESVRAGIRRDKMGILPVAARAIAQDPKPGERARALRDRINLARLAGRRTFRLESINKESEKLDLLKEILENGCLKLGRFKLKSGKISPFYLDLRRIISNPDLLAKIADVYLKILEKLDFDRIAAIPLAALPIATAISLKKSIPFIYPRLVPKDHGTGNVIEGIFKRGERVVLIDDVITTARSKLEAIKVLNDAGLLVSDLIVLVERDSMGREELEKQGIRLHSYAGLLELLDLSGPDCGRRAELEAARKD